MNKTHVEHAIYQIPEYAGGCPEIVALKEGHYDTVVARVEYLTKDTGNIVTKSVVIDHKFCHELIKGLEGHDKDGIPLKQAFQIELMKITSHEVFDFSPEYIYTDRMLTATVPDLLEAIYKATHD